MPPGNQPLDAGLLDALDIGLIVIGPGAKIVAWNSWMTTVSGVGAEAAVDRRLDEVFPEANLRRLPQAVADALATGATSLITHALHPGLLPLRTPAGQALFHNVSVRGLGLGDAARCVVQVFDITAATKRERVLRDRQNARYDAVVFGAPDAILTLDAEGLIQLANPAAARSFGYDGGELVGRPISLLFYQPSPWQETWAAVLRGAHQAKALELVARRKDGSPSYHEVSASRWASDGRVFVTAILRDANERHAADAALRKLNETLEERVAVALAERKLLADIVDTTDAFIQVIDKDYRLLAVNQANADEFQRVFGTRPKVGDVLTDLLGHLPEESARVQLAWSRALAGEAYTVVQEFGDPSRDRRFYELKFDTLHDATGAQIGAFQFVYDVTNRIEREEQLAATQEALRQSQKMEAIGQLTGGIAHDFNNLLTGIVGAMDILKRRIANGRYEDTQRFMDAAVTSANRAAALTHRLLAFARRQPLDPKPVDANHLIRGIEDLLARTLGEQIQLRTELDQDLWRTLSDPNQLENAILNLAINARDAMPEGGRLVITTQNLNLPVALTYGGEEVQAGDYTVITVADTGAGMDTETAAKVFEPFFTTKPIGQGTGLGLSMIYGFVQQTRGHIRLETTVGEGTTFSLYLPRYRGELTSEDLIGPGSTPTGAGEAVLLVEDDSSVRLLIGEVLRELGYACVEAIDAQAALPMLASNARLDLMITDVGLPGMNGRQLAEIARQHRPDLKILFVTGYAEHATGSGRFVEPGMQMVTKPFTLDGLAMKIREMIISKKD